MRPCITHKSIHVWLIEWIKSGEWLLVESKVHIVPRIVIHVKCTSANRRGIVRVEEHGKQVIADLKDIILSLHYYFYYTHNCSIA